MRNGNTSVIMTQQQVYINETQYIGRVKSAKSEIKRKTQRIGGLGGVGQIEVPTGKFEPITASVTFEALAGADIRRLNSQGGFVSLRMTGKLQVLDSLLGLRRNGSMTTRIRGYVLNPPTPGYSDDASDYTANISVQFISVDDDNGPILMIDFAQGLSIGFGN